MSKLQKMPRPSWMTAQRAYRALACGVAGWLVSFGLVHWGGSMARYLPEQGVHLAAFWGAMLAGYILASGFGRAHLWGWGVASVSALVATILGAFLGAATLIVLVEGGISDAPFAGYLGVIAIADGATSPLLVVTWMFAMIGVDAFARWVAYAPNPTFKNIFK